MALFAVGVAVLLRLTDLGGCSLWMDEGFTLSVARASLGDLPEATAASERAPPLYYLFTHLALSVSHTDAALRAPAALLGILCVLAAIWLGGTAYGLREGALGGLLLSVSALHVMMSRDARAYTTAAFFVTVSTGLWLRELAAPGRRSVLIAWVLTSTLAVYAHYISLACIGLQVLFGLAPFGLAASRPEASEAAPATAVWRSRLLAASMVLGAFAPWLPIMRAHSVRTSAGIVPVAFQVATTDAFPDTLFVQAAGFFVNLGSLWQWYGVALAALLLMLVPVVRDDSRPSLLLAGVCGGTMAALIGISMGFRAGIYNAKYLVLVSPIFWVLAARTITLAADAGARLAAGVGLAALLVLNGVSTSNLLLFDEWHNQDWRGAVHAIARSARTGDVVLVSPVYAAPVVEHYASRVPVGVLPPRIAITPELALSWSGAQVAQASRVWLLEGQSGMVDPTGRLARTLDETRPRLWVWSAYRRNPSLEVRVRLYGSPR